MSGDITIKFGEFELTVPATPAGYCIAALAVIGPVATRIIIMIGKRRRNNELPPGPDGSDVPVSVEPGGPDGTGPADSQPQLPELRRQRSRPQPNRRRRARQRQSRRERRRPPARR